MFDVELRKWYRDFTKLRNLPEPMAKLGLVVTAASKLDNAIRQGTNPQCRREKWEAAKRNLAKTSASPDAVLDVIVADLEKARMKVT
jgi:hypothetical protein